MTEKHEPLVYNVNGVTEKKELRKIIYAIIEMLEKDEAKKYKFKIKIVSLVRKID